MTRLKTGLEGIPHLIVAEPRGTAAVDTKTLLRRHVFCKSLFSPSIQIYPPSSGAFCSLPGDLSICSWLPFHNPFPSLLATSRATLYITARTGRKTKNYFWGMEQYMWAIRFELASVRVYGLILFDKNQQESSEKNCSFNKCGLGKMRPWDLHSLLHYKGALPIRWPFIYNEGKWVKNSSYSPIVTCIFVIFFSWFFFQPNTRLFMSGNIFQYEPSSESNASPPSPYHSNTKELVWECPFCLYGCNRVTLHGQHSALAIHCGFWVNIPEGRHLAAKIPGEAKQVSFLFALRVFL